MYEVNEEKWKMDFEGITYSESAAQGEQSSSHKL